MIRKKIQEILDAAGARRAAVQNLCAQLFPGTRYALENRIYTHQELKRARKGHRVAHPEVLRFYFQKVLPPGVPASSRIRLALAALCGRDEFATFVDPMSPKELDAVLERLQDHVDEVAPEGAELALSSLLSIFPKLREETSSYGDVFPGTLAFSSLAMGLVGRAGDRATQASLLIRILDSAGLSVRLTLLSSHRNGESENSVLEKGVVERQYAKLVESLETLSLEALVEERELGSLLLWVAKKKLSEERLTEFLMNDQLLLRIFRSLLRDGFRVQSGDAIGVRHYSLPWRDLADLFGEQRLRSRVEVLCGRESSALHARESIALKTANQYVQGELQDPTRF